MEEARVYISTPQTTSDEEEMIKYLNRHNLYISNPARASPLCTKDGHCVFFLYRHRDIFVVHHCYGLCDKQQELQSGCNYPVKTIFGSSGDCRFENEIIGLGTHHCEGQCTRNPEKRYMQMMCGDGVNGKVWVLNQMDKRNGLSETVTVQTYLEELPNKVKQAKEWEKEREKEREEELRIGKMTPEEVMAELELLLGDNNELNKKPEIEDLLEPAYWETWLDDIALPKEATVSSSEQTK